MNQPVEALVGDEFDGAFQGNRLLATLGPAERNLLRPHMTLVEMAAGDTVLSAGSPVTRSLFPFDSLVVSMMVELSGGRSVEVASVGKEGAVGGIVSCGNSPAFTHAVVQIGGPAVTIPIHALELAKQASKHLEHLFCRYADYLLAQVMQSAACNSFHPIDARAARWLLHVQDRVGDDRITLTQEALAAILGVQRTTVNAVARVLQEQGLISYRRGNIQVADREGLMKAACECYAAVEGHFAAVLGEDGRGGPMSDCA
ncbi:Crp/Fnr family transcriptional regulator [Sphingomonas arenae]|uniref:Crp/Fnr family transcriptional regulator n=1 Tax=Sphingomonas arenae TaxID=2812555 RepID=UPI00196856D7|nr:Crp/Fnr family transcriptional regulator [Sphingomonas arenae]